MGRHTHSDLAGVVVTESSDRFGDDWVELGHLPQPGDRERYRNDGLVVSLGLQDTVLVPVDTSSLCVLIVSQLRDSPAVRELSVDGWVERLGKSAETLVDGRPCGRREVDAVVDVVPESSCKVVALSVSPS